MTVQDRTLEFIQYVQNAKKTPRTSRTKSNLQFTMVAVKLRKNLEDSQAKVENLTKCA